MSNDYGESDVTPTESETTCTVGNLSRGAERPQRLPFLSRKRIGRKRRDAITPTCSSLAVFFWKRADGSIVPEKQTNKAGTPVAESVEERGSPEGMLCSFALVLDIEPGL